MLRAQGGSLEVTGGHSCGDWGNGEEGGIHADAERSETCDLLIASCE